MRKFILYTILTSLIAIILSGCENFFRFQKQSLILEHYQGSLSWAGINLGQSTMAEVKDVLNDMGAVVEESYWQGEINYLSDIAICAEIDKRYHETGICIWFVDYKVQFIDFFGDELNLDEIQTYLGRLDKTSIYTVIRGPNRVVEFEGISFHSGYIVSGILEGRYFGKDTIPDKKTINKETVLNVDFINPGFIDVYYDRSSAGWNFFFEEGGFEDWRGYGEYEVKEASFLD